MIHKNHFYFSLFTLLFVFSCQSFKNIQEGAKVGDTLVNLRFPKLVAYEVNPTAIPRSIDKDFLQLKTTSSTTWTSGFFAGNLWYIYQLTNDEKYKEQALLWTKIVEQEKSNNEDHDIGFKIYNSFGNAYKITQNKEFADIIVESANTLVSRYNNDIKAIQSWNSKKGVWDHPVIIDNMMNLELLFEASLLTKNDKYYNVAVNHANTTLKNHFREDNSTYHVVDYLSNGNVKVKKTHQGYSDNSAWARGQSWAVYGYTMAYRYTKDPAYLKQAEQTAIFFLKHENLPADGIPYWDFNDPTIPQAPKDVSAATIMASAFYELYGYSKKNIYLDYANKVLANLQKPEYLLGTSIEAPFILTRSTGNYNKNSEIDCPIVYADYYFLEALLRQKKALTIIRK